MSLFLDVAVVVGDVDVVVVVLVLVDRSSMCGRLVVGLVFDW